ncbi:MAG: LysM peptidoglycan-binding domain-containing protein, partial [Saccharothrix sp.]|nr:LysM peptidoglycan-binding domain-containing protein [Saccharothrix sp.]
GGPGAPWLLEVAVDSVPLPSIGALTELAGVDLSDTLPAPLLNNQLQLTTLDLTADLSAPAIKTFTMVVGTAQPWPIAPPYFSLDQASIGVVLDWTSGALVYSGFLMATLDFGDGDVVLVLRAELRPDKSWLLTGELAQPVALGALVQTALGFTAPDGLANVSVTALSLRYDTGDQGYAFAGGASWVPDLAGVSLEVDASVALSRVPITGQAGKFAYAGRIEGDLKSHFGSDTLALSLACEFQEQPAKSSLSYVFKLVFNALTLTGTYAKAANGDAVVTVKLGGVTFGDIVAYLVHLVDPGAPATLGSPWDVLYKIHFDDLELVVNLTQRTLGVKDTINLDLGLVTIRTIALTYVTKGGSPTVDIAITGSFLGQDFTDDRPLGWDLLNESPPTTPGAGAALLDLRDLGIGQHLVLAPGATTIPEVLAKLHEIIVATDGQPTPWRVLRFDAEAGWLIGADLTVMGTVSLGLVFNDPVMYGLQVSLAGEKAGPFAGLVFQILYRKVSADVGVYHIALQLPTLMRHLEFGAVSVTLPNVVLDIYTDGGFYIDFGFPHHNDWSVCFGVQVFPFVGAGGFYVGRLTAADGGGALVPRITNGTFGPVVEFGLALALGVGKEISEGPLKAGISVTVQGVLTGVVAWFNPTGSNASSARYYRVDGSLAIVGKLYGSVDFKVISVSVSVVASVTASVVIEAYAPIHLGLSVDVRVQASIKVLFVRIHFSFGMHLDASFTIGSQQATPWTLGPGSGGGRGPGPKALRRAESAHHEFAGVLYALAGTAGLEWKPVRVLASKQVVDVTLLPIFTVAPNPTSGTPEVTIAFTPSVRTTPPNPGGVPTPLDQVTPQPFDWLVTALLRWGLATLTGQTGGNITAVDLLLVYEDLTAADISQRGFDYTDLAAFLADNVVFTLVAPDPSATQELPGAVLPMPPPLTMTPQGLPPVDFAQAPRVDSAYQRFVQQLLDRLVVNYDYNRSSDPVGGSGSTERTLVREGGEAITEALFADWLLLVARSSVQAAMNELAATRYNAYASTETLIGIARGLAPAVSYTVRTGDTIPSIAQLFGITSTALIAANGSTIHPGQVLTVPAAESLADYVTVPGDTLDAIAAAWQTDAAAITAANPPGTAFDQPGTAVHIPVPTAFFDLAAANLGAPLATGTWPISGLRHNVRVGDDLTSVARQYGSDATTLAAANADQVGVLLANGVAALRLARADGTGAQYTIAAGDTLPLIAAYVLVRAAGGTDEPEAAWYTSAISAANGPLGTGPVTVPTVQRTPNGPLQQTGTVTYLPKTGDTVGLIGGYFTLTQLYPEALNDTIAQLKQLNPSLDPDHPQPGQVITVPVVSHVIAAGDTLSGVAARFGLQVSDLAAQQANATAAILTPNSVLAVPPGTKVPVTGTLQTMASALDLTVAALAGRIGAFTTLFTTGTAVVRPHARQSDVDSLVTRLIGSGQTADVAGMASHFMLHGLRLPMPPDPQTGRISALYRITGQQFAAPAKIDQTYPITFTPDGSPGWVQPIVVHVTKDGETVATIAAQYQGVTPAQILALNPGIDPDHPPATVRVPQPTVTVALDQATLTGQSPSTTFDPRVTSGPVREPLFHPAPVTHTVGPQVAWTAPTPPNLGGAVGGPAYWALPASLLARLAAGQVSGEYLLGQSPKGGQLPSSPQQVPVWSWATVVPITVRRVTAGAGSMPGTYLVVGADQTDRDVLLSLWTSLEQTGSPVQLFLAYPGASGGLVSDPLTDADRLGRVAVLKANLSTITSSGASALLAAGVPPATDAYATLAAPVPFLRLLWEASITGSGGFYLDYSTATQDGLPSSVFSGGADGVVHVVALVGDPAHPDRTLHPYTTGAVVGSALDPSTVDVFAYAESGDTTVVPTAPPGNIGFGLRRTNPDPGGSPTAETRTQSLFSLLSFGLTGTGFTMPPIALPAGPTVDPADTGTWQYDQTVPVAKLVAPVPPDPAAGVLPASADDPYLGVAKQQGGSGGFAGASVVLSFAFT